MKTAISVPDEVFEEAEQVAAQAGISRSQLYVTALREYLDASRDERTTALLNSVYEAEPQASDAFLRQAAAVVGRRSEVF